MKSPSWLASVIVGIISVVIAFFAVVNVLFSDRNGPRDAEIAVIFVFIVYLIASTAIHLISRRSGWRWFWWLVAPAVILGGGFALSDMGALDWYPVTILGTMVLATVIGRMSKSFRRR